MDMGDPLRDQELFEKIRSLPEEKVAEVQDFVDFLTIVRMTAASLKLPLTFPRTR
jgi:hypothetical protein